MAPTKVIIRHFAERAWTVVSKHINFAKPFPHLSIIGKSQIVGPDSRNRLRVADEVVIAISLSKEPEMIDPYGKFPKIVPFIELLIA